MRYRIIIGVFIFVICGIASGGDTIEKTFSISPGKLLEVDLKTGGTISVLGWDKNEVKARVFIDGRDWRDCEFEFEEKPSGIEIISKYDLSWGNRKCDIDLELSVPEEFDLYLKTAGGSISVESVQGKLQGKTNGGNLDLENLRGDIYFGTNGGSINCDALSGKVDITTNGGRITCSNSEIDGRIHTNGGSINIYNVSGDFDCTTNGGEVTYDNDRSFNPKQKSEVIKIRTRGGDIDVADAPFGADVQTNGGDIDIDSANEFVIAETNGGNIYIDEINGWVEAHTNGGNVTVKIVGSEEGKNRAIELSSNGGEIDLTLPPDFSAAFDVNLAYTKNSRRNYKIISDFNLETKETDEWDYSQGTPRKYIDGVGEINGGRNKIRIRTINGDVVIKKG